MIVRQLVFVEGDVHTMHIVRAEVFAIRMKEDVF